MSANDSGQQVGGTHYKDKEVDGEQHWDRMWKKYRESWFIGNITKYLERFDLKDGLKSVMKAGHYLEKLIELEVLESPDKDIVNIPTVELDSPEMLDLLRRSKYSEYACVKVWNYKDKRSPIGELRDASYAIQSLVTKLRHEQRTYNCGCPLVDSTKVQAFCPKHLSAIKG